MALWAANSRNIAKAIVIATAMLPQYRIPFIIYKYLLMDQSFLSTVSTICEEVLLEEKNRVNAKGENVGNKNDNVNFSNHNPFIQWSTKAKVAISYLATSQLERVIGDLEAFSRYFIYFILTLDMRSVPQ